MVVNTNCKYIVEHPLQAVGVEELTGLNMTEYHLTSSFPHLEWSRVSGIKFMLSLPLTYGRCNWARKVLSVRGRFIFSGDMTCSWDDICTSCSWKQLLSPSVHLEVTYPIQSQHFPLPPLCFSSCGIWN